MKQIKFIILLLFLFFCSITGVSASNQINKISMDIYVDNNGNAHITEVWDAKLSEGTEGYHPYFNIGNAHITDFTVTDESGTTYTYKENWDVKDSFANKKNKYGIYIDGSEVDLCWGISSYGEKVYTLKYNINNYVYKTNDGTQILYWSLIPYGMKPGAKNVYIKIYSDNKYYGNMPAWVYGSSNTQMSLVDGYIEIKSINELKDHEYVSTLVKFPENYFNTSNEVDKSWNDIFKQIEDKNAKTMVVESTEETEAENTTSKSDVIIVLVILAAIIILIIVIVVIVVKRSKKGLIDKKELPNNYVSVNKELPFGNDYQMVYLVAKEYSLLDNKNDFLEAILLKWIINNNINITKEKDIKIVFKNKPEQEDELELYNMMETASKDNCLEKSEFEKFIKENMSYVSKWLEKIAENKLKAIESNQDYIIKNTVKSGKVELVATTKLNDMATQLAGLRKYFKEFKVNKDKPSIDKEIIKEYLIYSRILGVSSEIEKEFKNIYANIITEDVQINDSGEEGKASAVSTAVSIFGSVLSSVFSDGDSSGSSDDYSPSKGGGFR